MMGWTEFWLLWGVVAMLMMSACGDGDKSQAGERGGEGPQEAAESLNPWRHVEAYVAERIEEFDQIRAERKIELDALSGYVTQRHAHGLLARLTFVCTENSRRSQFAQIWSAAAVHHFSLDSVQVFSGGTDEAAFNQRAVGALRRAGMEVRPQRMSDNPWYSVRFAERTEPVAMWSKLYNHSKNPKSSFAAVLVCDQAQEACPVVVGADRSLNLTYKDPKVSDGTGEEFDVYDERCAQIAREMLYVMSNVK